MDDSALKFWTAVLGFLAVVVGVLLGKLLELGLNIYRRSERELEICLALYVEIKAGYFIIHLQNDPKLISKFRNQTYSLGPASATNFAFESIKSDLSILPSEVMEFVFNYYRLDEQVNLMIDYLNTELYKKAPPRQKMKFREETSISFQYLEESAYPALDALHAFIERRRKQFPTRFIKFAALARPVRHSRPQETRGEAELAALNVVARIN